MHPNVQTFGWCVWGISSPAQPCKGHGHVCSATTPLKVTVFVPSTSPNFDPWTRTMCPTVPEVGASDAIDGGGMTAPLMDHNVVRRILICPSRLESRWILLAAWRMCVNTRDWVVGTA